MIIYYGKQVLLEGRQANQCHIHTSAATAWSTGLAYLGNQCQLVTAMATVTTAIVVCIFFSHHGDHLITEAAPPIPTAV